MICMLTSMAKVEFKTEETIATPYSVNTQGHFLIPIRWDLDVAFCDIQFLSSSLVI